MTTDVTDKTPKPSEWLEAGLTILFAQLLAVVLLFARYSVAVSLGVAAVAATLFLARRLLCRVGRRLATQGHRIVIAITSRLLDRRTYRFSLRTLLLATLIIAVVSAWLGYRHRVERLERHLLDGRWLMLNRDGVPLIKPEGTPYFFDFSEESYAIDPLSKPRRIDFHTPQGVSRAIYRWEGDEIRITQVSPGVERPVWFDQSEMILEPGFRGTVSIGSYRLRRATD